MKKSTTVKTVKKTTISSSSGGAGSNNGSGIRHGPSIQTRVISGGESGLRHSLRGSGKVWKKTVLGKKYEIAEKLKEKKNYIMFHSGMGHEKNVIEEIEQIPQPAPKEKIIEERQIIDNYEYHETKNLKKKKDPRRETITHHQRLSSPFERTVLKKYGSYSSKPQQKSYTTTTIKKSNYGSGNNSVNKYSSFTTKQEKNKTVVPSKLYETYKPSKNTTSFTQTKTTKTITTENKSPIKTSVEKYQSRTITKTENNKYEDKKGLTQKYQPKYVPKNKRPETETNKREETKTETTQDGDYLIKITTTRKPAGGSKPFGGKRPEDKPRAGSVPKGRERPKGFEEEPRGSSSNSRPRLGFGGPHGPMPGARPGFGGPHGPHGPMPGARPGFGGPHGPHGPMPGARPGFGGPHGPHGPMPGSRPGFGGPRGPHGPMPGARPGFGGPHGPHGPMPGARPGFGGPHGPHGPMPGSRPGFGGPHRHHGPEFERLKTEQKTEVQEDKTRLSGRPKSFERPGSLKGPRPGAKPEIGSPHSPYRPGSLEHSPQRLGISEQKSSFRPHKPGFGPHGPRQRPGFERPRSGFGPHGPGFGPHGPRFGPHGPGFERPRPGFEGPRPGFEVPRPGFEGPRPGFEGPRPGFERPRPGFEGPRPGFEGPRPGFGPHGPGFERPRPEFGSYGPGFAPQWPGFGGPRPGFGPQGPGFEGPRPGFGTHGVFRHKPGCPLYQAMLEEERRRAESLQKITRSFEQKTFSASAKRPSIGKKYGSQPKGSIKSSERRTMTVHTEKKSSNSGGTTQINLKETIKSTEGGDNYNYYESKHILKKGRRLPITIHHRRGEFGAFIDDIPERKHHNRSSTYTKSKASTKISTNLNKTFNKVNVLKSENKPRGESAEKANLNKSVKKSTFKQIKTTKLTKNTSGTEKKSAKKPVTSSYSEYKKYEQKGKVDSRNTGSSKYQLRQNTDYKRGGAGVGTESSYQYSRTDEYRQGGPSYTNYDEKYQYTQTDEYRYGGNNMGTFSSQYQYFDDNDFEIIDCPVHGRQTIRKSHRFNYY